MVLSGQQRPRDDQPCFTRIADTSPGWRATSHDHRPKRLLTAQTHLSRALRLACCSCESWPLTSTTRVVPLVSLARKSGRYRRTEPVPEVEDFEPEMVVLHPCCDQFTLFTLVESVGLGRLPPDTRPTGGLFNRCLPRWSYCSIGRPCCSLRTLADRVRAILEIQFERNASSPARSNRRVPKPRFSHSFRGSIQKTSNSFPSGSLK